MRFVGLPSDQEKDKPNLLINTRNQNALSFISKNSKVKVLRVGEILRFWFDFEEMIYLSNMCKTSELKD